MSIVLALAAAGAVVALSKPKSKPVPGPIFPVVLDVDKPPAIDAIGPTSEQVWVTQGSFECADAEDLEIPDIASYVPPQIVALGGPIALGVISSLNAFLDGLRKIGKQPVCTVTGGGEMIALDVEQYAAAKIWVRVSWAYDGDPPKWPVRVEVFAGTMTTTGALPRTSSKDPPPPNTATEKWPYDTPKNRAYLRSGSALADFGGKWRSPLKAEYMRPRVEVVRTGQDLALGIWLPPRGGNVRWLIEHRMTPT